AWGHDRIGFGRLGRKHGHVGRSVGKSCDRQSRSLHEHDAAIGQEACRPDGSGAGDRMSNRDRIRQFIVYTFFVDGFADDESFLLSGIIDSTGMMELVLFLEEEFYIKVQDTDLVPENLDSLAKAAGFVGRKLLAADAAWPTGEALSAGARIAARLWRR